MQPRQRYEDAERNNLHKLATSSSNKTATFRQHVTPPDALHTEFRCDYNRIIHSRSFRRLRHKTQVFILAQNDHICTRMEHSL